MKNRKIVPSIIRSILGITLSLLVLHCSGTGSDSLSDSLTVSYSDSHGQFLSAVSSDPFATGLISAKVTCSALPAPQNATSVIGWTINYVLPVACRGLQIIASEIVVSIAGTPFTIRDGETKDYDATSKYRFSGNRLDRIQKVVTVNGQEYQVVTRVSGSLGISTLDIDCPEPSLSNIVPVPGTSFFNGFPDELTVDVDNGYSRSTGVSAVQDIISNSKYHVAETTLDGRLNIDEVISGGCIYEIEFKLNPVTEPQ